jgi:hypothetical protein
MTTKIIYNPENPNGLVVEMTTEEIAEMEQMELNNQAKRQAQKEIQAQKEADALAGNNKLLELGLTQAQVTAMTGYTPPVAE